MVTGDKSYYSRAFTIKVIKVKPIIFLDPIINFHGSCGLFSVHALDK